MGRRLIERMVIYLIFVQVVSGMTFSPEIFYIELGVPLTHEVRIMNSSNTPKRYTVKIIPEEEKGWGMIPEEWVRFYPRIVSVGPQSSSVVRFRVNAPRDIEEREYRANILLEEMGNNEVTYEDIDEEGIMPVFNFRINYKLPIYALKGEGVHSGEVENIKYERGTQERLAEYYGEEKWSEVSSKEEFDLDKHLWYSFNVKNQGNTGIRTFMAVTYLDERNRRLDEVDMPLGVVMTERTFEGVIESVPEGVRSVEVEVYNWDFREGEKCDVLLEERYSL